MIRSDVQLAQVGVPVINESGIHHGSLGYLANAYTTWSPRLEDVRVARLGPDVHLRGRVAGRPGRGASR